MNNMRIEISKDLVFQELDGEMVILDMKSGQYFGIDAIGSIIWHMLEQKIEPARIIEKLQEEYDVEAEVCSQQVLAFLDDLMKNNIISIC